MAQAPIDDLIPCMGHCCSISSLFFDYPACFGCANKGVCCCIENESLCCKFPLPGVTPDGKILICNAQTCYLVSPVTCVKSTGHHCCVDSRCALPCDEEVPCMCNLYGLNLCYDWKMKIACCAKVSAIKALP